MMKGIKSCAVAFAVVFAASGQSHAFSLGSLMHSGSHGHSSGHSGSHSGSTSSGGKTSPQAVLQSLLAGPKDACGKGNIFSGKITIRSGEGIACKNRVVAAAATMLCGKRSDFAGSHCGKNAKRALAGQPARTVLLQEAQKGGALALTAAKKLGVSAHAKMTHKKNHVAASEDHDEDMAMVKKSNKRKHHAAMDNDDEDMTPVKKRKRHHAAMEDDEDMRPAKKSKHEAVSDDEDEEMADVQELDEEDDGNGDDSEDGED